jgi:hypothetical protein
MTWRSCMFLQLLISRGSIIRECSETFELWPPNLNEIRSGGIRESNPREPQRTTWGVVFGQLLNTLVELILVITKPGRPFLGESLR